MLRLSLLALAFAAAIPGQLQTHNVRFSSNAQVGVIDWNGRLALLIATPGQHVATFGTPSTAIYRWRLDVAMVGLVSEAQCVGSQWDLDCLTWSPWYRPPIEASGHLISPHWGGYGMTGGNNGGGEQRFSWDTCSRVRCYAPTQCQQLLWNVVVAYPVPL